MQQPLKNVPSHTSFSNYVLQLMELASQNLFVALICYLFWKKFHRMYLISRHFRDHETDIFSTNLVRTTYCKKSQALWLLGIGIWIYKFWKSLDSQKMDREDSTEALNYLLTESELKEMISREKTIKKEKIYIFIYENNQHEWNFCCKFNNLYLLSSEFRYQTIKFARRT